MDFVLNMRDFVLKVMDFVLNMRDFVLKVMNFILAPHLPGPAAREMGGWEARQGDGFLY